MKAIGRSRRLHRFARVGLAPPIAVMPRIDRIDASQVNLGLLGHSYAAETRAMLSDIHRLIWMGFTVAQGMLPSFDDGKHPGPPGLICPSTPQTCDSGPASAKEAAVSSTSLVEPRPSGTFCRPIPDSARRHMIGPDHRAGLGPDLPPVPRTKKPGPPDLWDQRCVRRGRQRRGTEALPTRAGLPPAESRNAGPDPARIQIRRRSGPRRLVRRGSGAGPCCASSSARASFRGPVGQRIPTARGCDRWRFPAGPWRPARCGRRPEGR